jgi:hypothetical protein
VIDGLDDRLPIDPDAVGPGTSLLVVGPGDAVDELALELVADGVDRGEGGLLVTTTSEGTDYRSRIAPDGTGPLAVVDCGEGSADRSRRRHGGGSERPPDGDERVRVRAVDSPRDLTDIGLAINDALGWFDGRGVDRVRVGLLSLTILFSYVDRRTVFSFCRTLTGRLDRTGAVGLFTLNRPAHDAATLNLIGRAFDGRIEVRRADDGAATGHEVRVLGLDALDEDPTPWTPL